MELILLFFIFALASLFGKIFGKLSSVAVSGSPKIMYTVFFVINGLTACIFFLATSGFNVAINAATAIYSLIYAVVVLLSIITTYAAYQLISVAGVDVTANASSLVGLSIISFFLFNEPIVLTTVIKVVIMILAVSFIFVDSRNQEKLPNRKLKKLSFKKLIPLLLIIIIIQCLNTVILKYFSLSEAVTNETSFFFFTNVILIIAALVFLLILTLKDKESVRKTIKILKPKTVVTMAGSTVCSNIMSIVGVWIIAKIDVSLYTALSSALSIITAVVGSVLFRERLGFFSYLAMIFAILAIII